MNHTLVTFLGRTRQDPNTGYQRAKYRFPDEDAPRETPFFGMALAGHLRPAAAVILGTSGSQWSVLVEHLAQGDEVETARLELLDAETPEDKAGCLARAAFFERTQNLSDATRQLRTFLPILDTPLTGAAGLFQTRLAERLRWIKAGGLADHQRKLAFEHLKRRDFLRAAVFGWEALHTLECERHGLPSDDYSTGRKLAMDRLDEEMHAGKHPEWKKSAFLLLRDVRNALAHGNPPRHRRSRQVLGDPDRLRSELEKAFQRLLEKQR